MRWIKISVPDDFDDKLENIVIEYPVTNVNYRDTPDWKKLQCKVWQPQYRTVLDKGFIGLIDFLGSDDAVVRAARVSYGTGTKRVSEDRGLIRYLIRNRHCYHKNMEVLTAEGWKQWQDCSTFEKFLVPDPNTKTYSIEQLEVKKFFNTEEMVTFNNSRMSYCVTPDHKMWFRGKYQKKYAKISAKDMSKWGWFSPITGFQTQGEIHGNGDDEFRFIGFFLGDGSGASTNRICFHLKKNRKITYLKTLLQNLNIPYNTSSSSTHDDAIVFYVETPLFLKSYIDPMVRSSNKHFPLSILASLTTNQIAGLFDGLISSDGSIKKDRPQIAFSSSSKFLTDLFCAVAARLGLDAHYRKGQMGDDPEYIGYHVSAYMPEGRTTLESRAKYHGTIPYEGYVYCATSSTGLLVVRGKNDDFAFICGNSTPIEMIEVLFHIKAPIFVFRQWQRHRTANINEYSARYSVMTDDIYTPDTTVMKPQSATNKQGRDGELNENNIEACLLQIEHSYKESLQAYRYLLGETKTPNTSLLKRKELVQDFAIQQVRRLQDTKEDWAPAIVTDKMIDDKIQEIAVAHGLSFTDEEFHDNGLSRELARMVMPLGTYSEMYWKCDLRNTFNFISLRSDPHAQHEIKVYSDMMLQMIEPIAPICVAAFIDYQLKGKSLSKMEVDIMRAMYKMNHHQDYNLDTTIEETMKEAGAGKREIKEFLDNLKG